MRCSGAPDRPVAEEPMAVLNCAWVTFWPCIDAFSKVVSADPLSTLLPLFVMRLMNTPDDCTDTSPPDVTTWISWNESKLKYIGEEFEAMSVMLPPSRFHWTLLPDPKAAMPNCWPEADPPTFTPESTMDGAMLMTCHGSRAVGTFNI